MITDFGSARLVGTSIDTRKGEELIGTTEYMAPEVGEGRTESGGER